MDAQHVSSLTLWAPTYTPWTSTPTRWTATQPRWTQVVSQATHVDSHTYWMDAHMIARGGPTQRMDAHATHVDGQCRAAWMPTHRQLGGQNSRFVQPQRLATSSGWTATKMWPPAIVGLHENEPLPCGCPGDRAWPPLEICGKPHAFSGRPTSGHLMRYGRSRIGVARACAGSVGVLCGWPRVYSARAWVLCALPGTCYGRATQNVGRRAHGMESHAIHVGADGRDNCVRVCGPTRKESKI